MNEQELYSEARVLPDAPPSKSRRSSFDEKLWTYHDRRHTGSYAECDGCLESWRLFDDHPEWFVV